MKQMFGQEICFQAMKQLDHVKKALKIYIWRANCLTSSDVPFHVNSVSAVYLSVFLNFRINWIIRVFFYWCIENVYSKFLQRRSKLWFWETLNFKRLSAIKLHQKQQTSLELQMLPCIWRKKDHSFLRNYHSFSPVFIKFYSGILNIFTNTFTIQANNIYRLVCLGNIYFLTHNLIFINLIHFEYSWKKMNTKYMSPEFVIMDNQDNKTRTKFLTKFLCSSNRFTPATKFRGSSSLLMTMTHG